MISGLQQGQMDERNGSLSTGNDERVPATLELTNSGCKFERGRRPIESVGVSMLPLVPFLAGVSGMFKQDG